MKHLLVGALGGIGVVSLTCLMGFSHPHKHEVTETKLTPRPMFEVVDNYKGCDVIRYTDGEGCVHYFLHCGQEV